MLTKAYLNRSRSAHLAARSAPILQLRRASETSRVAITRYDYWQGSRAAKSDLRGGTYHHNVLARSIVQANR